MTHQADIDIDFANRQDILKLIKHIPARKTVKEKPERHNSGVYAQPIPFDPMLGCSAIHFKEADERGYFKIDFLNVTVYQHIKDNDHYDKLMAMDPPWHRLAEINFVEQVAHISNYPDKAKELMPTSIEQMAMFISILRPGKKHLYGKPWKEVAETVWEASADGYSFRQSHAIAYAHLVVLHMNIINEYETNQSSELK